jgi:glycosyltransferase involved in cell wall biosynthesis
MRVAQLVETLAAGGAEALAVDIAGALAARGHDSHLIVLRGVGPLRDRVGAAATFHDLARPPLPGPQAAGLLQFLMTCRILESRLRESGIEILQTHLPMANFLGLVMAWRGICRVYPTVHNNREFDYGEGRSALRRALRRSGYRQMLRHCDGLIAVSEQVKSSLTAQLGTPERQWKRIQVVPNGVRIPAPLGAAERAATRAAWGVSEQEVLIVAAGRLTRQKNFSALLDALALLPATDAGWRCIIAGEGELRGDLERQLETAGLSGRVRLAGLVGDLPGLLAAADIFCLPSLYEGLPLVLLEAMAAGLPVVAFAIDGVRDVLTDGTEARLVAPGEVSALAAALGSLLPDAAQRLRLGRAARETVEARHGFATVVERLEAVYRA